ncbi:hypothetical protein Enr13x_21560 [Stieleria neptunia]|uniref:Uncharacterized protein n=1 Tax=Stieleria neptunia TaxID=2527979 RepID=A0A518HN86_9BACT|nr:hypothetical protein [Stieleria neptunia]QDV42311.1 hypothetical protein Enr13x_21560 [Stieleria neptunia]
MKRYTFLFSIIVCVALCSSAAAQNGIPIGPAGTYSTTPTLSPYLDLFRSSSSPLPNYQQFVRPQLQLRQTLQLQNRALQQQERAIRSLGRRSQTLASPSGITKRAGTFLNYSRFYPTLQR